MTQPIVRDLIYCGHVYDADVFDLYVQWYITDRLSYRDMVAMMAERKLVPIILYSGIQTPDKGMHRWFHAIVLFKALARFIDGT